LLRVVGDSSNSTFSSALFQLREPELGREANYQTVFYPPSGLLTNLDDQH